MKYIAYIVCGLFFAVTHAHAAISELPFESKASHFVLMDAGSGAILASRQPEEKMYPSSMTKLMTLYITFEELKAGRLHLDDTFAVSEKAWSKKGSKMFVPLGEKVTVEDLIRGIAVQSGNDACIVVAEGIAGSEAAFAVRMNLTAKELGMKNSHFVNSSGWPDEEHYTTAMDLAILAKALIRDFPAYYPYFAETEYTYNNIRQFNRNPLLGLAGLGVDGLKTGHTEIAGYGIVLSARQSDGARLILVINGLPSEKARSEESADILGWGFASFAQVTIAEPGVEISTLPVRYGVGDVSLISEDGFKVSVPRTRQEEVKTTIIPNAGLKAPIAKGDHVATMEITIPDMDSIHVPLKAAGAVKRKGFFGRIPEYVNRIIDGDK